MVARLIEGWESSTAVADYAGKWTALTVASLGSASGRHGNGIRLTGATHEARRTLDAQATWVVGFAFRTSSVAIGTHTVLRFEDGGTVHCGLGIQSSTGLLLAFRGTTSTVLGTSSAGVASNTWAYVEVKATISDTAGVFVVRLNGTTVLNLSGQDTRNAGNASANAVRFGATATISANWDVDDVYVFDATGSVNADFAGDCKVEQVLPSGAGATTGWTPSAGSNWDTVNDSAPDGDSTYVSASSVVTDTYAHGDLAVATSGTVKCVQASVLARKDDAGSRSIALVARPGSTDRVGATQALGDSYARYTQVWDTNPDTATSWTVAECNSSQFGQKLIA